MIEFLSLTLSHRLLMCNHRRRQPMSDTTETEFDYAVGNQRYCGLLLKALGGQAKVAVVLLPDWRGQSALARDHAGHMVALGCVVAIADLYGDGFSPDSPDQVGSMVKRLID